MNANLQPRAEHPADIILIVDDVDLNNVLVSEAVRPIPGTAAKCFTNPRRALDFLTSHVSQLGVVVTDFEMPEMTGLELVRAARQVPGCEHVPIVMVTSHDQRDVRREALEAGATDFVRKPFDSPEIKARITNYIALNRALRAEQDKAAWLASEVAKATATIMSREREIVRRLARAAEHRDTDTGDHITRVAGMSRRIAEALGCELDFCRDIELAATMHDIGKLAVPDAVLLKPGPLTPAERALICRHAEDGYRILEGSASDVIRLGAEIAISHHERWDGTGYPRALAGEAIPLSGRIVAVADVYDALTSDRPYKKAWSEEAAAAYIAENAGTQFDPRCVEAFFALRAKRYIAA